MMETFSPLSSASIVFFAQKYAKTFPIYQAFVQAFPGADKWGHRIIAGTLSLAAGMGISIVLKGTFDTGWDFTGHIPAGWTLLEGLWHSLETFAVQQFAYEATRKGTGS